MDVFGIVYLIENAQQFWSELEDILHVPPDVTLDQLDATLRRYISFCASYHEHYLQSPLQLEHACDLLIQSELLTFHSERMCELLLDDAKTSTDPHCQLILYNVLLAYGRRHSTFLRSHKRWMPIIPLLMDHVRLDIDPDIDDAFIGGSNASGGGGTVKGITIPIEAKLRMLSVRLLYEVCRVQKLALNDLRIFDDTFIEHLFDLVEQTRDQQDETFNYAVIKLIVALNEQFMLASLQPNGSHGHSRTHSGGDARPEEQNRVLRVLMARLGSSMTFGENMIFMLNRAGRTAEDLVMQLLVLKILYLLFTTKGCTEFFYTNDLCVLVDVFLREILNLDEENESLRHTYLRVLHPLLTKTQLRTMPYKRAQIVHVLESLIENENIRDVNPTTKRLVLRCLSGDWCVQFRKVKPKHSNSISDTQSVSSLDSDQIRSPALQAVTAASPTSLHASGSNTLLAVSGSTNGRPRQLKTSHSAEDLRAGPPPSHTPSAPTPSKERERSLDVRLGSGSNDSSISLPRVAAASTAAPSARRRDRAGSFDGAPPAHVLADAALTAEPPEIRVLASSPFSPTDAGAHELLGPDSPVAASSLPSSPVPRARRTAPAPPPPRRRKPPAIPTRTNSGATITTIASSASPAPAPRLHSPLGPSRSGVPSHS